jgi:hypothetical protein
MYSKKRELKIENMSKVKKVRFTKVFHFFLALAWGTATKCDQEGRNTIGFDKI